MPSFLSPGIISQIVYQTVVSSSYHDLIPDSVLESQYQLHRKQFVLANTSSTLVQLSCMYNMTF